MRLGMMRVTPEAWNPEANMAILESMAQEAADKGVDLLMMGECFLDGYCVAVDGLDGRFTGELRERFESMAQKADSPYIARAKALCRKHNMGMIFPLSTWENGEVYNTALLLDRNGEEIGRYHKTHLYSQDLNYAPGEDFPVFDTEWGKIGMLICADRRWPEAARTLRVRGAQMLLIPTYGMRGEANTAWMRTRAYENECYLAFCHPHVGYICNPDGEVEAYLESNVPGILVHDITPRPAQEQMFYLRRTDIYEI